MTPTSTALKVFLCCFISLRPTKGAEVLGDLDDFHSWMASYEKKYVNEETKSNAFNTWMENKKIVEIINNSNTTWTAELNQFADMTSQEFQQKILMRPQSAEGFNFPISRKSSRADSTAVSPIPEDFDWRELGAVTSVKDQGSVGTCWAFSTVGSIEGQWFLKTNELVDLSPEYLVDCDGSSDTEAKHADCSVFGGWPYLAYDFVIDHGGIPTEATYPYCSGTGDCYPCMLGPESLCGPPPYYCDPSIPAACPQADRYASIRSWRALTQDENELQSELVNAGPLSALLDATQLQLYKSGIWEGHIAGLPAAAGCHASSLDHAVLLVGYGTENGEDFWTVKNSWGQRFGEQGYFRMQRGKGMCGINTAVTTAEA